MAGMMNLTGADSMVVNGQLLPYPTSDAWSPSGYGAQTIGVPNITPAYPSYLNSPTSTTPGAESVGGYGTAGMNNTAAAYAHANPWSLKGSPTVWAVGGLIGALVLLKAIHWRETLNEAGAVGPIHEAAGESA